MRRPRRAFTLIEAMVVVTLAGIGAGLGLASLRPVVIDARMHGAARGIAALVRAARVQAIARHERVRIADDGQRLVVSSCPAHFTAASCVTGTALTPVPGRSIALGADAVGVSMTGAATLVFGPHGRPEGSVASYGFLLKTETGSQRLVTVSAAGEVSVQ
jgi:prepilin-type N-terminal cleavage/methylation domain-containing protein